MVSVCHAFLNPFLAFRKHILIAFREVEWSVGGGGEQSGHERLFHLAHTVAVELQELLVPNGPRAVEVVITIVVRVFVVFRTAEIVLEAAAVGKGLEAHRAVHRSVEEGGIIAFVLRQLTSQSGHVVQRGGSEEERLHKARNARQHARHALDALAAVGVGILERERAVGDEGVEERSESRISFRTQVLVVEAEMLLAVALHNQHHHILWLKRKSIGWLMNGIEIAERLGIRHIVGSHKRFFVEGADGGERRVQDDSGLRRIFGILVRIADGDRPGGGGESTAHPCHRQRNGRTEQNGIGDVVAQAVLQVQVFRRTEQLIKQPPHQHGQKHQIPIIQKLLAQNVRHVAETFVAELIQHRHGRALTRVLIIDTVYEVGGDTEAVDDGVVPARHLIINAVLFPVERQQEHDDEDGVGIDDG